MNMEIKSPHGLDPFVLPALDLSSLLDLMAGPDMVFGLRSVILLERVDDNAKYFALGAQAGDPLLNVREPGILAKQGLGALAAIQLSSSLLASSRRRARSCKC